MGSERGSNAGRPGRRGPGHAAGWLTDRYRYYLPDGSHGVTEHPPGNSPRAAVTIEENRVFARTGPARADG